MRTPFVRTSLVLALVVAGFSACNQHDESSLQEQDANPVGLHLNDANELLLEHAEASQWLLVGTTMVRNYSPDDDVNTILNNFQAKAFRYHFEVEGKDTWVDLVRGENSLIRSGQVYCPDPGRKDLEELSRLFGEQVSITVTAGLPPNQVQGEQGGVPDAPPAPNPAVPKGSDGE